MRRDRAEPSHERGSGGRFGHQNHDRRHHRAPLTSTACELEGTTNPDDCRTRRQVLRDATGDRGDPDPSIREGGLPVLLRRSQSGSPDNA